MVEEKKTPQIPASQKTEHESAGSPLTRANPNIPTTSEWATTPPVGPEPTFGWPSKRIDIFPRVPFDPKDFLNLQASGAGDMLSGLPGMIADKGTNDKISRVPETDIPFGAAVAVGTTGDGYCKVAATAGDKVLGIAMRDMTSQGGIVNLWTTTGLAGYPKDHWSVAIVRRWRVWAVPTTAVREGDPVGFGAGGALQTGGTAVPGCIWTTSAPANMLAIVELNLP